MQVKLTGWIKKYFWVSSPVDLLIYDDIYPHPSSGFRLEEITVLLRFFENARVILSGTSYSDLNIPLHEHDEHISILLKNEPGINHKLVKDKHAGNIKPRLFYCLFLNNVFKNLSWLQKNEIPFVFTLYPGGGFVTGDTVVNEKLRSVFSSPYFKKVIVTQQVTMNYLLENKFCDELSIAFIFGGVVPQISLTNAYIPKLLYGKDKDRFDICFCAVKYSSLGADKGYPLFISFIKAISKKYEFLRFHIIGNFDKNVIAIEEIEKQITFYGSKPYEQLRLIFKNIDLIVSPNEPGKLSKGAFDGFPLGTVVEAVLNGAVAMVTDFFHENKYFEDGKEIIIIEPDLENMVEKFELLMTDLDRFYSIAENGRKRFSEVYSDKYQMTPRIHLLQSLIK